jgi:hypothetical protein
MFGTLDVGELGTLLSHETDDGDACGWTDKLDALCPDFRVTRRGLVGSDGQSEFTVGTELLSEVAVFILDGISSAPACFCLSLDRKILVEVHFD